MIYNQVYFFVKLGLLGRLRQFLCQFESASVFTHRLGTTVLLQECYSFLSLWSASLIFLDVWPMNTSMVEEGKSLFLYNLLTKFVSVRSDGGGIVGGKPRFVFFSIIMAACARLSDRRRPIG